MKLFTSLDKFESTKMPIVLTLGNFDGVHLGHQHVLSQVTEIAEASDALSVVVTFLNPPSSVFTPEKPLQLICSCEQKLALIEEMGINRLILLPFTKEFSEQSAESFLREIKAHLPLSHFVLGYDSRIGKDRLGDEGMIRDLGKKLAFKVDYCEEVIIDGSSVSSSRIRHLIASGDLEETEKLLGRKLSYILRPQPGQGLGKTIGFSTLNFDVQDLCLPPLGVYSVWLKTKDGLYESIANLGYAPTVRHESRPQLEVHVIGKTFQSFEEKAEVIFHQWIRSEQKFDGIDSLREQIKKDILTAKQQLERAKA